MAARGAYNYQIAESLAADAAPPRPAGMIMGGLEAAEAPRSDKPSTLETTVGAANVARFRISIAKTTWDRCDKVGLRPANQACRGTKYTSAAYPAGVHAAGRKPVRRGLYREMTAKDR